MAWLLLVAVLLLKRWIRFLAQEIVQSSTEETKHTQKPQDKTLYPIREDWLAFKMLIPTEIQYLQSHKFEIKLL